MEHHEQVEHLLAELNKMTEKPSEMLGKGAREKVN